MCIRDREIGAALLVWLRQRVIDYGEGRCIPMPLRSFRREVEDYRGEQFIQRITYVVQWVTEIQYTEESIANLGIDPVSFGFPKFRRDVDVLTPPLEAIFDNGVKISTDLEINAPG